MAHYGVKYNTVKNRLEALERHGYLRLIPKSHNGIVVLKIPPERKPKPFRRRPYLVRHYLQRDKKIGKFMIRIFHFWESPNKKQPIENPMMSTSAIKALEQFKIVNIQRDEEKGKILFVNPLDDYNKIKLDKLGILRYIEELKELAEIL